MNKETVVDLNSIRLATPCDADWSKMSGDDRKRFCLQCNKHVYNITSMTESEASTFLAAEVRENRIPCLRFFRRVDGTILFQNCTFGLKKAREAYSFGIAFVASVLSTVFGVAPAICFGKAANSTFAHSPGRVVVQEGAGFYNGGPEPSSISIRLDRDKSDAYRERELALKRLSPENRSKLDSSTLDTLLRHSPKSRTKVAIVFALTDPALSAKNSINHFSKYKVSDGGFSGVIPVRDIFKLAENPMVRRVSCPDSKFFRQ